MSEYGVMQISLSRRFTGFHQLYFENLDHESLEDNKLGDCWRTSIACLLRTSTPEEVPHFMARRSRLEHHLKRELPWSDLRMTRNWLRRVHGLDLGVVKPEVAGEFGCAYILSVNSKSMPGFGHVVIAREGKILHDPSPLNLGYSMEDSRGEAFVICTEPYEPNPTEQIQLWSRMDVGEEMAL